MRLTVLVDNATLIDRYFLAEPGLSLLVEDQGTRVLLDTGYSGAFLDNARRMGLDLLRLDYLVLSHGHLDHTWGLDALCRLYLEAAIEGLPHERPVLVAHPEVFCSRLAKPLPQIGSAVDAERLGLQFALELSRDPVWLSERLVFLGQIERLLDFETPQAVGQRVLPGGKTGPDLLAPDLLPDDTGLAYVSARGLVVLAGCAHAGICNMIEQARRVTGVERVADVVGGLHLLDPDPDRLRATADYLGALGLDALHACHCTDLRSKIALAASAPLREVGVGLRLDY